MSGLRCMPSDRKQGANQPQVGSRPRTSVPIDVNVTTPYPTELSGTADLLSVWTGSYTRWKQRAARFYRMTSYLQTEQELASIESLLKV